MSESKQEIESNVPKTQELRVDLNAGERGDGEDAVYSPVITVTKEETTLTKEDMKVQKVVISENVSDTIIVKERILKEVNADSSDGTVFVSVTKEEATYSSGGEKGEKEDVNINPKHTKIPKLNFKQAVDKVNREERSTREKDVHEPILGIKVRSSIPRLKEAKLNAQKIQQNGEEKKEDSKKLDDEFDKIYDEIKDNATDISIPTPESLRDADIVDSIFEEIIHAYDENVETIKQESSTEKVKSKIPLLKRKSEQDILVPNIRRGSLKKRNSIDDSKISVQAKSITVKDLESTKIKNSKISGSYARSKSEFTADKKIESVESSSVTKTIRNQKSVETEHSNVSTREVISVKSNEAPRCKIPIKSHIKDNVETKLSSTTLNKLPAKANIIDKLSRQKVDVEKSIKAVVEVEKNIKISENTTREILTDEQKLAANARIVQTNDRKTTHEQIIKTNQENESATTESKITSNIDNINVNSTNLLSCTETKEISQNINTQTSERSISVVRSDSESILSQSDNLSTYNVNVISNNSNESNNVIIQELTNNQKILTSDVQDKNSVTTKIIETVTTLEYDSTSNDLKRKISSNRSVSQDHSLSNTELKIKESQNISTVIENNKNDLTVNYKHFNKETKEKDNGVDSNIKLGKNESVFVTSNVNQSKFAFDKKESSEYNSVQRLHSVETASTSIIDISKENNNLSEIVNKDIIEKIAIYDKIQNEKTHQHRAVEISNKKNLLINNIQFENKESNIIQKEVKESEKYVTENNDTKNMKTIIDSGTNNDSDKMKLDLQTDNVVVNDKCKSLISSQIKNMDDLDEEDIIILKGKVSRIISRLDSREVKIEKIEDDIPNNVSVVSKVAIFERNEPEINKKEPDDQNGQNDNTKPIIVDEILKPHQNINIIECGVFNDSKKDENAFDYNSVFNKVHSSVLKRLKSIETKTNINLNKEVEKEETKINKTEMEKTKINEEDEKIEKLQQQKPKEDDKLIKSEVNNEEFNDKSLNSYNRTKSLAELHFNRTINDNDNIFDIKFKKFNEERRAKSLAELDLGDTVKGRVRQMVTRMNSIEKESKERRVFERCRSRGTILSRAAVFEKKIIPVKAEENVTKNENSIVQTISEEELKNRIEELLLARTKYGRWKDVPNIELRDGSPMPVIAVGTALLEPKLVKYIVSTAIDLGYRAIDTAFIYGNEKEVGEAIRSKIEDGTVKREELFIISKLWSTFHRRDLVETACRNSLQTMGLEYFDLYMIHNPMSFREGSNPIPKIANVLQYSQHDYLEAWYGMEAVAAKGSARRIGVSNFNSAQIDRIMDKAKIKPVVNQVECHPYLNQRNLDEFCANRNIKLSCYSVLGSKGTPLELKSGNLSVIDDPLVQVMAAGLGVTPAQLLIAYQLFHNRNVVVKSSTGAHLWDNLQALNVTLDQSQVSALDALNKNKRTFTFKGMGDTHKNYPFKTAF